MTLLYFYFIIGTYTTLPISWLLTYFKDSFIYAEDKYKWNTCSYNICTKNQSVIQTLSVTVPYYLNTFVLKRNRSSENFLELEPSINLAIIWVLIFICLCYGLRSYGKLIYFLSLVPLILLSLILLKFLQEGSPGICKIFQVSWTKSLTDVWSWILAAREVVLTWILYSNAILQICSFNKTTVSVTRNFFIIVFLVIYSLLVSSFAFSCVFEILHKQNISYIHSSYENISSIRILNKTFNTPEVVGLLIGDFSVTSKLSYGKVSGYQPIRLLTELFPSVLSIEGPLNISQFWAICFYFAIILFALGQHISIWWCVVISVITINSKLLKAWEILITFSLCVAGYLVSLPMTTKIGISIIYFLDCCISSLWPVLFIYFIMLITILFTEGKPYSIKNIQELIIETNGIYICLFLTCIWYIILPSGYLFFSVLLLRSSQQQINFPWHNYKKSWPSWSSYLGLTAQILPPSIMLLIFSIQIFYHLQNSDNSDENRRFSLNDLISSRRNTIMLNVVDSPPKYTPPPSYSTATSRLFHHLSRNSTEIATINVRMTEIPNFVQVQSNI